MKTKRNFNIYTKKTMSSSGGEMKNNLEIQELEILHPSSEHRRTNFESVKRKLLNYCRHEYGNMAMVISHKAYPTFTEEQLGNTRRSTESDAELMAEIRKFNIMERIKSQR